MSADLLREAAALMRERAEAATPGPWVRNGRNAFHTRIGTCIATTQRHDDEARRADADHLAGWHPGVALAVANWLDLVAKLLDQGFDPNAETNAALAVARAYLGTDA